MLTLSYSDIVVGNHLRSIQNLVAEENVPWFPAVYRLDWMCAVHRAHLCRACECKYWCKINWIWKTTYLDVRYVDALRSASRKKIQCHNKCYQDHGKNWKQICFHTMKETVITVDYLSNSWEVDRLLDTVINSKLTSHFVWNGIPNNLVSDNGAQYDKLSTLSEWQCWRPRRQ